MPYQDFRNPPVDPKREEECITCRYYWVYGHSQKKDYHVYDFNNHYCSCRFCEEWVRQYKKKQPNLEDAQWISK